MLLGAAIVLLRPACAFSHAARFSFQSQKFRSANALFGGHNTASIKSRLGIKAGRALADYLPTVTLKAKEFAAAITEFNVRKLDIFGVQKIGDEHVKNNHDVRAVLAKSNITPEDLPAEEDIQKLERRVKKRDQQLLDAEHGLNKKSS